LSLRPPAIELSTKWFVRTIWSSAFQQATRVLELGAGQAWAACIVKQRFPHLHVFASDICLYGGHVNAAAAACQEWSIGPTKAFFRFDNISEINKYFF
jgi:methylase of polypeptide subunit release factors